MVMWHTVEFWIGVQPTTKQYRCSLRLPPYIDVDPNSFYRRMSLRLIVESEQVLDGAARNTMGDDYGLVEVPMPAQVV
eukprot:14032114-Alexandrium_andersonii.AAC.1